MKAAAACIAFGVLAASVMMVGPVLAQSTGGASPNSAVEPPRTSGQAPTSIQPPSVVEPPRTTGQAPTNIPPSSHRQPRAEDVPPDAGQAESHAANREIDRRLNICRGF